MNSFAKLNLKELNKKSLHPEPAPDRGSTETALTPIALSGVITPWRQALPGDQTSDYMLATHSGLEYFIVSDLEWRDVLSRYCWEEVKVIGLLNFSNMTLIPQKVYPKGPTGEKENVIDLAEWKSKEFIRKMKKMAKTVNDLVLIPAAVIAMMAL